VAQNSQVEKRSICRVYVSNGFVSFSFNLQEEEQWKNKQA